ncbi:hypothetical protein DESC_760037 [Desulfosarcina cetonica]|nr:hypothetical protein DESC_760037 [Desulfosarcina cetonica]
MLKKAGPAWREPPGRSGPCGAVFRLLAVDKGSHVLAVHGPGDVTGNHAVDDLHPVDHFAVLNDFQARPLDDQIVQVTFHEIPGTNFGNERGIGVFLGVGRVKTVFILDEQDGSRTDQVGQDHQAHIGAVDGDAAGFGFDGEVIVRRHAMHDRNDALGKVGGQFDDVGMGHLDATPGGKQCCHHQGVLLGNHAAEFGDDTGGHAHFQTDGVDMAATGAAAGGDHQFVLPAHLDDLLENGRQGLGPPIANGLAADFHRGHIRIEPLLGGHIEVVDKFPAHQAFPHEPAFDVQTLAILVPDQWHGLSFR